MAKKLTKAQIAKNPTKAINSGKMKMQKQEVPFGGIGKAAAKVAAKAGGAFERAVVRRAESKGIDYSVTKNTRDIPVKTLGGKSVNQVIKKLTTEAKETKKFNKEYDKIQKQKAKANARGLKAANKPVSKNNAGQNASKLKVDILKNAKPLRANRTRLGKSAFKSK